MSADASAAEFALLGAVLMAPGRLQAARTLGVTAQDFHEPTNGLLWQAFESMDSAGTAIDVMTVATHLGDRDLERVGGYTWLGNLPRSCPSAANAAEYAKAVKQSGSRRRLRAIGEDLQRQAADPSADPEALIDSVEADLQTVRMPSSSGVGPGSLADAARDAYNETIAKAQARVDGVVDEGVIPTGLVDLDKLLGGGFRPTDAVVIAARPAMGKTAFAGQVLLEATRHGKAVRFFSLEMSRLQLGGRFLVQRGLVDAHRFRMGTLHDSEWAAVTEALDVLERVERVTIDDTPGMSIGAMRSACRQQKQREGLDLVLLDYLQLAKGIRQKGDSREQEIASLARGMKLIAKELDVVFIGLSQLNRMVEQRGDKRPMMSDLRESGAIEQDADVIIFPYRDAVYNESAAPTDAEFGVAKQRGGAVGTVKAHWRGDAYLFQNAAPKY